MKIDDMDSYFKGEKLYGDDFDLSKIEEWFNDEKEGYAGLGAKDKDEYTYEYHALNYFYGFKYLPKQTYPCILGFGSAYGDELKPISKHAKKIIILEPSDSFLNTNLTEENVEYVKPNIDGLMSFEDNSFDIITCFSVLHHIPNVSTVLKEMFRCLKPGGYLLVREPTVSMGDWRITRIGLTKRERGIPLKIFEDIIKSTGFKIISCNRCDFSLTSRLRFFVKGPVYNSMKVVYIDKLLSKIFSFNNTYHAKNILQKFRPASVFYVLYKE